MSNVTKYTKYSLHMLLVLALLFTFGMYASAQEGDDDSTVTPEEETTPEEEVMEEETPEEEEELTEEEIEEIIEESEVIEDEEVENLDDLEGEVIAVTDDTVVIEQEDGEIVTVSKSAYTGKVPGRRVPTPGSKIQTGKVTTTANGTKTVTVKGATYTVLASTPVIKNGTTASVEDLEDNDNVAVIVDESGTLIALEVLEEVEKAYKTAWIVAIIAIAVIILFFFIFRKKKPAGSLEQSI